MLLYLSISGISLSLILFYFNFGSNKASIYLSLFIFLVSLYGLFQHLLLFSNSIVIVAIIPCFAFLLYLIGPALYLYTRSILSDDAALKKKDLWHLTPMIVYLAAITPYIFSSFTYKTDISSKIISNINILPEIKFTVLSKIFSVHILYISRPFFAFIYTLWSIVLVIRYLKKKHDQNVFSRQQFMIKWLAVLLGFQSLLVISYFIHLTAPFHHFFTLSFLQIISGIGLLGLSGSLLFFPTVLYGLPRAPVSSSQKLTEVTDTDYPYGKADRIEPGFETDYLLNIGKLANDFMQGAKPYLRQDCNLAFVSRKINIPAHHLAYYFREVKKQSFNDFRNEWRVKHAINLICQGKREEITLEAIGSLSGFSSRNAFFNAFKKSEGVTPGAFSVN